MHSGDLSFTEPCQPKDIQPYLISKTQWLVSIQVCFPLSNVSPVCGILKVQELVKIYSTASEKPRGCLTFSQLLTCYQHSTKLSLLNFLVSRSPEHTISAIFWFTRGLRVTYCLCLWLDFPDWFTLVWEIGFKHWLLWLWEIGFKHVSQAGHHCSLYQKYLWAARSQHKRMD